ncbi:hypothetical protein Q8A73_017498 [Channa argus]|nr:hypothetical protein Q8A73_017498 [Channa argus]
MEMFMCILRLATEHRSHLRKTEGDDCKRRRRRRRRESCRKRTGGKEEEKEGVSEREIEREKQAGQGPAVGPDPYGAAGSGMNSEWSGWALGCWNLPPSLCEQDDQRQEGALQMAWAINR